MADIESFPRQVDISFVDYEGGLFYLSSVVFH